MKLTLIDIKYDTEPKLTYTRIFKLLLCSYDQLFRFQLDNSTGQFSSYRSLFVHLYSSNRRAFNKRLHLPHHTTPRYNTELLYNNFAGISSCLANKSKEKSN